MLQSNFTGLRCILGPNVEILTWTNRDFNQCFGLLVRICLFQLERVTNYRVEKLRIDTNARTQTVTHTQATTISKCENWPPVNKKEYRMEWLNPTLLLTLQVKNQCGGHYGIGQRMAMAANLGNNFLCGDFGCFVPEC